MKKELFIADLKDLSRTERFESTFIVQKKEIRQKKSGDQFLVLRLADRTGWLDARVWDNVPAVAEVFETSDFIAVRGKVQEYNGQFQIIVHKLTVLSADQVDPGDFLPRTQRNIDEMYGEVLNTIDNFSNPNLNRLLGDIFRDPDMATRFQRAPAASGMHHAKVGGLLEHVLSCLQMAKLVAAHYSEIDSDLLASGVLLHDFGKIFELSAERSIEYTDEGRLLGHIAMGSAWLERRCDAIKGFPPRLKILLLHLVLSHHGKLEFGSPKEPLFPEALALHYIDDLDSRLEMMREVTGEIAGGGVWSPYHRGLERSVLDKAAFLRSDGNHTQKSMGEARVHRPSRPASAPATSNPSDRETPTPARPTEASAPPLHPPPAPVPAGSAPEHGESGPARPDLSLFPSRNVAE